jgi:hypothetical protein
MAVAAYRAPKLLVRYLMRWVRRAQAFLPLAIRIGDADDARKE